MNPDRNWLDQWRLLFAASVLYSHSFDLLGREAEEPFRSLARLEISGLGVCGFFAISGYLISKSWDRKPELANYLRNRLLRIAPGFVVAFVLSVLIVGALASGAPAVYLAALDWPLLALDLVSLHEPSARTIGPFPGVNDALWTIRYEALCYLLAPLAIRSRMTAGVAWLAAAAFTLGSAGIQATWLLCFASGAVYYRFALSPQRWELLACGVLFPISLVTPAWEFGLAICGTYLLLWAGLKSRKPLPLPDISYGTYLYGWPVQKLLILAGVSSPWLLMACATPIALICGAASWYGVERWAMALKQVGRSGRADEIRMAAG